MGVGVYGSVEISVTKVYGPTLLELQGGGGGGCPISRKKRYVTLEWRMAVLVDFCDTLLSELIVKITINSAATFLILLYATY